MATIEETVTNSLRTAGLAGYVNQARPVIDALVARESEIVTELTRVAVDEGMDRGDAIRVFTGLGLAVPQAAERIGGAPEDLLEQVRGAIQTAIAPLVEFARRNGYNG